MAVIVISEQQIERINRLENQLANLSILNQEELLKKASSTSWNVIETMEHLCLAHQVYRPKAEQVLLKTEKLKEVEQLKCSFLSSWMIEKTRPKANGDIQLKMKTLKPFQPTLKKGDQTIEALKDCLEELKNWVNTYRTQPISLQRFNSAIGPLMRFNLPEACEFMLVHMERHFVQIHNILKLNK